jgi:hypothetical protein
LIEPTYSKWNQRYDECDYKGVFHIFQQVIRQNLFLPITGILVLGRKMYPTPNPEYGMFLAGADEKGKILLGLY